MMKIDEYCENYPSGSQGEIAEHLGLSRPYLNQILNFRRQPSGKMMLQIMLRTGGTVTMDSWAARTPPPEKAPQEDDATESDDVVEP